MIEPLIETELGELPASWRAAPLGEFLSEAQYGASVKGTTSGGFPILRMTNQVNGRISIADLQYADVSIRELESFRVQRGDILFNRTNSFELVGRTALFDLQGDYIFASYLIRLRTIPDALDPFFLNVFLNAAETQQRLKSIATRAVSQSNISATRLRGFVIPIPPLAEQRKIATVLAVVQRAVEHQERLIALSTELKNTLLHHFFAKGLRGEPQRQSEIGPVPESWAVTTLDHVARIERGKFTHRPRNDPRFYGGQTPFVQTGDVSSCDGRIREFSQTLNEQGVLISKIFPAGTILITIAANIGFSGILEFDSACPDSLIGLTPNERIDAEFLQHYLTIQQPVMDRLAPRGTQKNINIQFLKPWPVPLPSKSEQVNISETLNAVDCKIRVARQKHSALTDLFRTLLHKLLTAQVRVNDLDLSELEGN